MDAKQESVRGVVWGRESAGGEGSDCEVLMGGWEAGAFGLDLGLELEQEQEQDRIDANY